MPWSWVNTEWSTHRALHTASTPSFQECLSSLHSGDCKLTPECSHRFRHASLKDRPPPASSPWELKGKVTSSYSHSRELTNWWIDSQHPACPLSTASNYSPNLARWWPASGSSNSLDHGLQVHLCVQLDLGLQVHLQTRSMTASKCISQFTRSPPPSASPYSLHHSLQVNLWATRSRPPNASPNSLDRGFQMHLWVQLDIGRQVHFQTCLITVSMSISEFTQSRSPSASPNSFDNGLQVHIKTRSITASKWISKLAQSWPQNSLDYRLQVHLHTPSITASECISGFTRSSFSGAPRIALNHRLQPVQIYCL